MSEKVNQQITGAFRMNAVAALLERAKRLREEADGLEALAREAEAIPISSPAEEALWRLAISR